MPTTCRTLGQTLVQNMKTKTTWPIDMLKEHHHLIINCKTLQDAHHAPGTVLSTSSTVCVCVCVCVCVRVHVCCYCCYCLVATSCLTLLWPHGLYSPPGSSVHGISQGRILEWVASSFSRGSSQSRDWTCISCLAGGFSITAPATWEALVCVYTLLILTTTLFFFFHLFLLVGG